MGRLRDNRVNQRQVVSVTLKDYLRCRRAWSKKRTQTQKQRGRRQRQSDKEKRQ